MRGVSGSHDLSRGQRLKNRIGDSHNQAWASSEQEPSVAGRRDVPGAILHLPIVADIVGADEEGGEPEQFCIVKFCAGHADSSRCDLNVDGLHVG